MSEDRHVGPAEVSEKARINRLRPKEDDFKGRKGYWRKARPKSDPRGGYDWGFKYPVNDGHGKPTREYQEVGEMLAPFIKADTARHLRAQHALPRAALKDKDGGVRYVDPALADQTARKNGWSHVWRAGGNRVERGIDGELWRVYSSGDREPTGRWCLTTPQAWAAVPEYGNPDGSMKAWDSETYDPDGNMWALVNGEPTMVEDDSER